MALVPTNKNKKKKKYEELWSKTRYLIRSITKNSDDYDKKIMKIEFNLDNELPLNETIKISSILIVFRAIFLKKQISSTTFF